MNPYPPPFDPHRPAPVPRDADRASMSELLPFSSRKIAMWRSPLIIVALLAAFAVPFLLFRFSGLTEDTKVVDALAMFKSYALVSIIFFILLLQAAIYFYARPGRSFFFYLWGTAFAALILSFDTLFSIYAYPFRHLIPGTSLASLSDHAGFFRTFATMFSAAGLCEELIKATPALIGAAFAFWAMRRPGAPGFFSRLVRIRGPLDGVLLGIFAAGGFIICETALEYVPNAAREAFNQSRSFDSAVAAGLNLLLPRVINGITGHMSYAALFGYFIGLGVIRRRHFWRLTLIGWVSAATVHALWNGFDRIDSPVPLYLWGGVSGLVAVAVILKARQLHLSMYGDAPDTMGSIVIDRSGAGPMPQPPAPPPRPQAPPQDPWFVAPPPRPAQPYRPLPAEATGAEPTQTTHHETESAAESPIPGILRSAPPPPEPASEAPLELDIEGLLIPVRAGVTLDLGAEPALRGRGQSVRGRIVPHPSRAGVLGLRNAGECPWTAFLRDGRAQAIGRDQNVRMAAGMRIDFGDGLIGTVAARGTAQ